MKRVFLLTLLSLLVLSFSIGPGSTEPVPTTDSIDISGILGSGTVTELVASGLISPECSLCEDLSAYSQSFLNIINDDTTSHLQIALTNSSRAPVQRAPIILRINGSGSDTYRVVYTNNRGIASFDYGPYNTSCQKFTAFYCYGYNSCSFLKCLHALGFEEGSEPYSDFSSVPLSPRTIRPTLRQSPALVKSSSATFNYCPTPTTTVSTTPAFCLPLVLIAVLLLGALYVSGRNPFMAFDLSNPHVGKHIRYTARQRNIYHMDTVGAATAITKVVGAVANPTQTRSTESQQLRSGSGMVGLAGGLTGGIRGAVQGARGLGTAVRSAGANARNPTATGPRPSTARTIGNAFTQSLGGSSLGRMIGGIVAAGRGGDPSTTLLSRIGNIALAVLTNSSFGYLVSELGATVRSLRLDANLERALQNYTNFQHHVDRRETTTVDGEQVTVTMRYTLTARNGRMEMTVAQVRENGDVIPNSSRPVLQSALPEEVSRSFGTQIHDRALTYYRTSAVENGRSANDETIRLGQLASAAASGRSLSDLAPDSPLRAALAANGLVFGTSDERLQLGRAVAAALTDPSVQSSPAFWEALSSAVGERNAREMFVSANRIVAYNAEAAYSERRAALLETMPGNVIMSNQMFMAYQSLMAHANGSAAQNLAATALANVASSTSESFSFNAGGEQGGSLIGRFRTAADLAAASSEQDLAILGIARATALNPQLNIPNVGNMLERFSADPIANDAAGLLGANAEQFNRATVADGTRVYSESAAEVRDYWRGIGQLTGVYAASEGDSMAAARLNLPTIAQITTNFTSDDSHVDATRYVRALVHAQMNGDSVQLDRILASLDRYGHASDPESRAAESVRLSTLESVSTAQANVRAQGLEVIDRQRTFEFARRDLQQQIDALPSDDPRRSILEQRIESLAAAYVQYTEASSARSAAPGVETSQVGVTTDRLFLQADANFRTLVATSLGGRIDGYIETNLSAPARTQFVEDRTAIANTDAAVSGSRIPDIIRTIPNYENLDRSQLASAVTQRSAFPYEQARVAAISDVSESDLHDFVGSLRQRELDALHRRHESSVSDLRAGSYAQEERAINERYDRVEQAYEHMNTARSESVTESRRIDREEFSDGTSESPRAGTTSYRSSASYAGRRAASDTNRNTAESDFRESVRDTFGGASAGSGSMQTHIDRFLDNHASNQSAATLRGARERLLAVPGSSNTDVLSDHLPTYMPTGAPTDFSGRSTQFVFDPVTRTMVAR
ncbi:hypothetical protein HY990_00890 [Candidatus Micrarchaeota archaeon]|nr:hypothetical protein [Candidatus Micrarchaeota archaeon]